MSEAHSNGARPRLQSWIHEEASSVVRMKATRASERRRAPRIPVEIPVFVHAARHFFQAETADVSPGGMFLVTNRVLLAGARVVLDFSLGGDAPDPLEIEGVVRWTRSAVAIGAPPSAPRGIAVAFENLSPEAATRLETYCKVREPLYYDLFEDRVDRQAPGGGSSNIEGACT